MCLNSGDIIGGHYRIKEKLGSGGFGRTYLAEDIHIPNESERVVKEITPQSNAPSVLQEAEERFNNEAKALYRLGTHPQIPQLFGSFVENGKFYIVQEFIEGEPLNEKLIPGRQLKEKEVIELLRGILEIIKYVHQQEVLHRDIKPSNLIQRERDEKIVLIDFGAVKEISTRVLTSPGQVTRTEPIGTRGYMAAEQCLGQPRYNSDIYSIGIIGIQAITGLEPTDFLSDPRTGERIWRYALLGQPMVQVSDSLATVLDKMVRYHFNDRYQSADAVLQDLQDLIEPLPTPKPSSVPIIRPLPRPKPSTWELLRQAVITGSCGWLLAMTLVGFLGTVWISYAFWLLISGGLIFGVFDKNCSIVEKLRLFVIAVIATGVTCFVFPLNFQVLYSINTWQQVLSIVLLLASLSGLFAFILLSLTKK